MAESSLWIARRVADLAQLTRSAAALRVPLPRALIRLLDLRYRQGYGPMEIFNLGMLAADPLVPPRGYYAKARLHALQVQVNPRKCFPYTEDKLVFFRRCREYGLATPEVHAVVSPRPPGPGDTFVETPDALLAALGGAPRDLALKPAGGVYGYGLLLLRFDGSAFSAFDGQRLSAEDLFTHMRNWKYADWLLQDRLFPHPELARLSGTQAMQTVRAISCIDGAGRVRIPFAFFRIVNGSSSSDNFKFGLAGNLSATVDLATGRLNDVFGLHDGGQGLTLRDRHPATGLRFRDVTLPFWSEALDLVERAARAFLPLRTIGWDVAITPNGPALLEGNVTWDPLPSRESLRVVDELLQQPPRS